MLIQFKEDVTVRDKEQRHYPKGCVVEMSQDACMHWISRGKAFYCLRRPSYKEMLDACGYTDSSVSEHDSVSDFPVDDPVTKKKKKRKKD